MSSPESSDIGSFKLPETRKDFERQFKDGLHDATPSNYYAFLLDMYVMIRCVPYASVVNLSRDELYDLKRKLEDMQRGFMDDIEDSTLAVQELLQAYVARCFDTLLRRVPASKSNLVLRASFSDGEEN